METKNSCSQPQHFSEVTQRICSLLNEWESVLKGLDAYVISDRRNSQDRTIRQILGHLVDSASNNTHRIIHLQYQKSPLIFPDYANLGNNDRWIAIQNYQSENWEDLVLLWKYINRHLIHIIQNVNMEKLSNEWISATGYRVTLEDMISDYTRHLELHLNEIGELMNRT